MEESTESAEKFIIGVFPDFIKNLFLEWLSAFLMINYGFVGSRIIGWLCFYESRWLPEGLLCSRITDRAKEKDV